MYVWWCTHDCDVILTLALFNIRCVEDDYAGVLVVVFVAHGFNIDFRYAIIVWARWGGVGVIIAHVGVKKVMQGFSVPFLGYGGGCVEEHHVVL